MQLGGPAGIVVDGVDAELDDEFRIGADHAAIEHVQVHQQFAALAEQDGQPAQAPLLFLGVEIAPAAVVEGLPRGPHGPVDILCATGGAAGELLAGGRIVQGHGLARQRRHDLSVDHVAETTLGEEVQSRLRQRPLVEGLQEGAGRSHDVVSNALLFRRNDFGARLSGHAQLYWREMIPDMKSCMLV